MPARVLPYPPGALPTLGIVTVRTFWAFCAAATLALVPQSAAQPGDQLVADERLFAVMAAINVAGYDEGLSAEADSPVRKAVRHDLESMDPGMRSRLRTFYEQHERADPDHNLSQYISFALMCGEAPFFDLKAEVPTDLPTDVRPIRGLSALLREFYEVSDIEGLWQRYAGAYEDAMLRYQEPLIETVFETNGYLRIPASSPEVRSFRVYFDLLAAPGSINMRSFGGDVKIVVHSSSEVRGDEIRAAYLMHLLDRMSVRHAELVARKEQLSRMAIYAPALDDSYKSNFQLLLTKSLAHAVQTRMRYEAEDRKLARIADHARHGFILAPYFFEKLAEYEAQPETFRKYYETLVGDINVRYEMARIQQVKFAERKAPARPRPRQAARPQVSETESLLSRAEGLLLLNELSQAREIYESVVLEGGSGRFQASYGLGRIALDEANPDLALEHFAAATEDGGDTRIQAMSHIYMGRIQDLLGNRELALGHYQSALDTGDTSPVIRAFGEQGLAEPFTGVEEDEED